MEQIKGRERSLKWKESRDDISSVRDGDVFLAVDRGAQEAGLHGHFHPESSVWLDGDRMGRCASLGLRERRPAAGFCHSWSGALLQPVRCDDRGQPFLSKLRPSIVSRTINETLFETLQSAVTRASLPKRCLSAAAYASYKFDCQLRAAVVSRVVRRFLAEFRLPILAPAMRDCAGVC